MRANPRLLLMDEPSMGLAPILVESIFETIRRINREGTTILLVEQNAHLALQVAHRGYVLQTGEIVLSDTAEALRQNPTVVGHLREPPMGPVGAFERTPDNASVAGAVRENAQWGP